MVTTCQLTFFEAITFFSVFMVIHKLWLKTKMIDRM